MDKNEVTKHVWETQYDYLFYKAFPLISCKLRRGMHIRAGVGYPHMPPIVDQMVYTLLFFTFKLNITQAHKLVNNILDHHFHTCAKKGSMIYCFIL